MEVEIAMSKVRLTAEQEEMRVRGLRILARIIVRHYLNNSDMYSGAATCDRDAAPAEEDSDERENAR